MHCPTLIDLPPPPAGKAGWPWTVETSQLPDIMPDGSAWPRISIVTPSYNQGQFIEETIRSVLLQGYPDLEYIIIDGGSSDGTVAIIKKYERWLTYWVTERDHGQANAISKGLERSTGLIFNWLNSDDALLEDCLSTVASLFKCNDAVAGSVIDLYPCGRESVVPNRMLAPRHLILGKGSSYHQPGLWLLRDKIRTCGGIDETFKFTFDLDMTIRYLFEFPAVAYTEKNLVRFRYHDKSKTISCGEPAFDGERMRVVGKLLSMNKFGSLHRACAYRRRVLAWRLLPQLEKADEISPYDKLSLIMLNILAAPTVWINRSTAGAIKRLLLNKHC